MYLTYCQKSLRIIGLNNNCIPYTEGIQLREPISLARPRRGLETQMIYRDKVGITREGLVEIQNK